MKAEPITAGSRYRVTWPAKGLALEVDAANPMQAISRVLKRAQA